MSDLDHNTWVSNLRRGAKRGLVLLVTVVALTLTGWSASACAPVLCLTGTLCPTGSDSGFLFPPLPPPATAPTASESTVSLPMQVSAAGSIIAHDSGTYDFGLVQPFASWSADFEIKNISSSTIFLDGASSVELSDTSVITVAAQPGVNSLEPDQTATFRLTFAPTTASTHQTQLSVLSADMPDGKYTFPISGNGQYLGDNWVFYTTNTGAAVRTTAQGNPSAAFLMETGAGDGSPNGGKVFLYNSDHNGRVLNTITSFTYDVFVYRNQSTATIPYLNIFVDLNSSGTFDSTDVMLVYSLDVANKDTAGNGLIADTWQTWDPLNDGLWFTRQNGVWNWTGRTTAQIMTAYGTGRIVDPWSIPGTPIGGIQFVVGSSSGGLWTNFGSYLDNLTIGFSGAETTFGF